MDSTVALLKSKVKQASLLWFEGFKEACCLHRVVILCLRSRTLSIRTGQCFLLNGFIFLGSIFILNSIVIPTLQWILPGQCPCSEGLCSCGAILKFYSLLRLGLVQLFYVLWFYPLCILSFVLSNIWYNDIAKYGFVAMGKYKLASIKPANQSDGLTMEKTGMDKPSGIGGVMIAIGEQVYSVLLLNFFFLEVYAIGYIPYVGTALNFLLLSWIYAYYSFEYKWNLSELSLEKRLDFFESNWAFFAGFGNPCILGIFFFPRLVSYGVMAILFPLFVLTATASEADQVTGTQRKFWKGAGLGRLPMFYAADTLSMWFLSLFNLESIGQMQHKGSQGTARSRGLILTQPSSIS